MYSVSILSALLILTTTALAAEPNALSAKFNPSWQEGDTYTYRKSDFFNKTGDGKSVFKVTSVLDGKIMVGDKEHAVDMLGNELIRSVGSKVEYDKDKSKPFLSEYHVGQTWSTVYRSITKDKIYEYRIEFRVVGTETVNVPAGSFNTYKTEGSGFRTQLSGEQQWPGPYKVTQNYLIAPGINRPIVQEFVVKYEPKSNYFVEAYRLELESYKQGSAK